MHYDIIIVGGGMVGRSIACALRHTALRIALIDASAQDLPDPRLIALNYGNTCFLNKIGLWSYLTSHSAPIHMVHVSFRGRLGATRLTAQSIQLPALGYVIRAHEINQALNTILQKTIKEKNLTEYRPATVTAIDCQENLATLKIESGNKSQQISGDLIIAADGTHSTIRQLLHFDTEAHDYQQSAIVTTTTLTRSHHHIAYERFLNNGVIAMLPLIQQDEAWQCATIWTAPTKILSTLLSLNDHDFTEQLQEQFGYRLGRLKNIAARHIFPLHFFHVKNPVKNNVILIGNAAHTIHPIAAQGLNLALYEIAHLTQTLLTSIEKKQSLQTVLSPQIIPQAKINLLLSHYLNSLFSSSFIGVSLARQLGMIGLDLCSPLKKQFSRLLSMENIK